LRAVILKVVGFPVQKVVALLMQEEKVDEPFYIIGRRVRALLEEKFDFDL